MSDVLGCQPQPGGAPSSDEQALVSAISEMRADLDRMVPHILNILRRDEEEHRTRLVELERRSREIPTWPLAVGVHAFVERMRQTSMPPELSESIQLELGALLTSQGFRTFGHAGQAFALARHEVAGASVQGAGPWVVDKVLIHGLAWMDQVVQRAVVTVTPALDIEEVDDAR
jgi:hypothetical protein